MTLSSTPPPAAPPTSAPAEHAPELVDPRRLRAILVAMCTALVAVISSVSGLNVAQQQMALDLGASQSTVLWIINGYTIALAALLLPIGAVGDRWGRRPVLLTGLFVFAAANTVAGLSGGATTLLVARIVAGVGAAMIMPVTLSVITSSFPAERRGRAIGVWAGFAGAGGIIGLFVSSAIVDTTDWRWVFALPVGLAAVAAIVAIRTVPDSREEPEGRFDTIGSILSALAIGGLVLGIHEGPEIGWVDPVTLAALIVGSLALVGFFVFERRADHPLLDVRVFADRGLAAGSVTLLLVFAVMFGLFLVIVQYLQAVLGWSALRSATGLLPMAAAMMPLSTVSPILAQRIGSRSVLLIGTSLFTTGLVMLALMTSVDAGYLGVLPGLIVIGVGMGLAMTPSTTAITEALPTEKQGVASALNDTVREVGGAVGIALIGSVLNAGYRSEVAAATEGLPPEFAEPVTDGIGGALAVAGSLGPDGASLVDAARDAFVAGWGQAMWVGAAMAAVSVLYLLVRGPRTATTFLLAEEPTRR